MARTVDFGSADLGSIPRPPTKLGWAFWYLKHLRADCPEKYMVLERHEWSCYRSAPHHRPCDSCRVLEVTRCGKCGRVYGKIVYGPVA